MSELMTPPDPEQAVVDHLVATGHQAGTALPSALPAAFVRVLSLGGGPRGLNVDRLDVQLESFARRETAARDALARAVATLQLAGMSGALGSETCYGVAATSHPQNYPLPSVPDFRRYVATVAVDLRRRVTTA